MKPGAIHPDRPSLEQSIPLLTELLRFDTEPDVRASAAAALSQLGSETACDVLIESAQDISPDVREAIAFALGKIGDERSIQSLSELTHDKNDDVFEWAIIALRQIRIISKPVRDRLVELLGDSRVEVKESAAVALAERKDIRAFILSALGRDDVSLDIILAPEELGDPRLIPELMRFLGEPGSSSCEVVQRFIEGLGHIDE